MLEEAIPALWSAVHGWFTPAVLFVVLNIVIGTIAVTSKVAAGAAEEDGDGDAAGGAEQQHRGLSRVPSMAFDRLRSFNLSRFAAPAPEAAAAVAGVMDLGYDSQQQATAPVEKEEEADAGVGAVEVEPEHPHAQVERSRSEAAAGAELPRLPARLHKSASDKSAFAHFGAEEVEEAVRAVEARRPATTRDGRGRGARRLPVAVPEPSDESDGWESEPEEEAAAGGGEVDARADDFINNFRHQLKLQRIDSILRNRRGQAAAV